MFQPSSRMWLQCGGSRQKKSGVSTGSIFKQIKVSDCPCSRNSLFWSSQKNVSIFEVSSSCHWCYHVKVTSFCFPKVSVSILKSAVGH